MDRFFAMRVFVMVTEAGSLAAAGHKLGLSPPAVTRSLASLEKHLGCRLLNRTTRALSLTEAGARYLEDCRRILQEVEESEEWLRGEQSALQGLLSLTAPVMFGQLYVMPVVRDFLDLHPRVDARVTLLDRMVSLQDEGHDLAVRIGKLPDSSLFAARVGTVRRVVCASPDYLAKYGEPSKPADLTRHRLVSTADSQSSWGFLGSSVRVRPRLLVNSNQAALDAVVDGWGITRHLSYQVAAHLQTGQLRIVLAPFEREPWPIHVVHHQGHGKSLKFRLFLDYLTSRLREHPALNSPWPG